MASNKKRLVEEMNVTEEPLPGNEGCCSEKKIVDEKKANFIRSIRKEMIPINILKGRR